MNIDERIKNKKIVIISVSIIIILISVISIYFIKNDKTDESAKTNNDSNNIEDSIIDNDYTVEIEPVKKNMNYLYSCFFSSLEILKIIPNIII